MIRIPFPTGFRAAFLSFFLFALQSSFSEAQISDKENALRQVVMLHPSNDFDDKLGAGLIVGEDNTRIYIVTAASLVVGDDNEAIKIEFRQYPDHYWPSSTHNSKHVFEDLGVAVITVEKQAALPIQIVEVQRSLWDESPSTVRFVGIENEKSRWKVTSDFSRTPEPDLELPLEHQLQEGQILTRTYFNLEGYKGGAMFDQGWHLFGLVLDDKKFESAMDRSSEEEVFDDEFTTTLSIQKLVNTLQKTSIPISPHLLVPETGVVPGHDGSSINISASVTRHDQTNKLSIYVTGGYKYDGNPVTYTIQAKDGGQWKEYHSGKITELASMTTQEQEVILPNTISEIRLCYEHPYKGNRYAFLIGNKKIHLLDKQDPLSKYLFRDGNPIQLMAISSPVFTSHEDACDVEFDDVSTAPGTDSDIQNFQKTATAANKLLAQATARLGSHVPLFPQKVTIGQSTNQKLKQCLGEDQLLAVLVFDFYPPHHFRKGSGIKLYTNITMEHASKFVVMADQDDFKYRAIVQSIVGLSSERIRALDTCMVSELAANRKIGVVNQYVINESKSLQGSSNATRRMNVEKVLNADTSINRIEVRIGKNDGEVCPGFSEIAISPEPVYCPPQNGNIRGSVSQRLLDGLGLTPNVFRVLQPHLGQSDSIGSVEAKPTRQGQSNSMSSNCNFATLPGDAVVCE